MRKNAILITGLFVMTCAGAGRAADADGAPLFDGKTLAGWDGDPKLWSVEDGCITGRTTDDNKIAYNQFLIWRGGEVDDFELTFEYRMEGGNSGVQYRSWELPEVGKHSIGGYQADFESGDNYSGILYSERDRGILAERGQKTVIGKDHKPQVVGKLGSRKELGEKVKKGDWNSYRVVARGYHFQHFINGAQMVDVVDEDPEKRRRVGLLALQIHQGPPMKVQFRNIRLKRLPLEKAKKAVLLAGVVSHGYLQHEHRAGCLLLADALNQAMPNMVATVYTGGWPKDPTAFDNADTILFYCDGADGHPALDHLDELDALMKRGVGMVCVHFGVEVPKGPGGDKFLEWIGGYFELNWSVNPRWSPEFKEFPNHPAARGLKPFTTTDEIYFHMRLRPELRDVTPILSAVPSEESLSRPDGPRSGNPDVRAEKDKPQHMAWAAERPGGGRGFGFTGGHYHYNWANPGYRRLILNALVWTAHGEVPEGGVPLRPVTYDDLLRNLEPKKASTYPDYKEAATRELVRKWNDSLKQ